jgi:putative zinc finger/helix-turn-helix YgiT family protein
MKTEKKDISASEQVMMECPLCGKTHCVERKLQLAHAIVKGEKVHYHELFFVCGNCEEGENEFVPSDVMDENLLAARNAYRVAHGMFTSCMIVDLRKSYGLTQRELANMLGWGGATISRYESKLIQDETHDEILHVVSEDALEAMKYLEKNKSNFDETRYREITSVIQEKIARTSLGYMTQKLLEARYMEFKSRDDLTGGAKLDIGKICSMASFFAQKCHGGLFKVKLMKLLWYADAVFYREYGHAMSGLVYQHKPLGALPVGHYELMGVIPHEEVYDNFEETSYRILPMESYDESCFTKDELNVLNKVIVSFQAFTGKEMAECMHKEDAYVLTADQAYIPYSLAKHVTI